MAKKNTLAEVAVAGGIAAVGALFGRKRKKDAERAAEEARNDAAAVTPYDDGTDARTQPSGVRTCPSCGNTDARGSRSCPVCFAPMPDADEDIRDGI